MKYLLPYLLFIIYKTLRLTWRVRVYRTPEVEKWMQNGQAFVVAHWHGDELGILHLLKEYHASCIISTSKDGDLMNKIVQLLGAKTVRGSSTRGGSQALKGIIRLKKEGRRPSVAVDGPKGPIYEVKPGVFQISRLTALPIVPISFYANRQKIFAKAWSHTRLPLPFAKITICWGEAMAPISKEEDSRQQELAIELQTKLNEAKTKAKTIALNC